eukprot:m.304626 g.304626  ORF g.304626 m.304626 type:complete len:1307 (-) comp23012_c3_seq7:18-3938(-)
MRLLDREHRSPPPPPQPAPAPPTANSHLEAPDEPTVRFRFFFFSDSQRTADEPVPLAKPVSRDIFNRVRLLQNAVRGFRRESVSLASRKGAAAGAASSPPSTSTTSNSPAADSATTATATAAAAAASIATAAPPKEPEESVDVVAEISADGVSTHRTAVEIFQEHMQQRLAERERQQLLLPPHQRLQRQPTVQSDLPINVRVFVSSCFRDMMQERQLLMNGTFPLIRTVCEQKGLHFTEVDLRWGVTEEMEDHHAVVSCLREVSASGNYFIAILGQRYGWVPSEAALSTATKSLPNHEWLLTEGVGKSLTHHEIISGVMKTKRHGLVFMRKPEFLSQIDPSLLSDFTAADPAHTQHLEQLKQQLRTLPNVQVREYVKPEELPHLVLQGLMPLILRDYPDHGIFEDPLEQEAFAHASFAEQRSRNYVPFPALDALVHTVLRGQGNKHVVSGLSGCGKSAFMAYCQATATAAPNTFVFLHFVGHSSYSASHYNFVRRLMGALKQFAALDNEDIPESPQHMVKELPTFLAAAAAARPKTTFVVLCDALNQLRDVDNARQLTWLPTTFPPNFRCICTSVPGPLLDVLTAQGFVHHTMPAMGDEQRAHFIKTYLNQFGKALEPKRIASLVSTEQCKNPLFLKLLLDELRVVGEFDTLDAQIGHMLKCDDVVALYKYILRRFETTFDQRGRSFVCDLMRLLYLSRHGLTEAEVLGAMQVARAKLSSLLCAVQESLVSKSGLLMFHHDALRIAVGELYLSSDQDRVAVHKQLADYFFTVDISNPRRLDELPWHLLCSGQDDRLMKLLTNIDSFNAMVASERLRLEVAGYWRKLGPQRAVPHYERSLVEHFDKQGVAEDPLACATQVLEIARVFHEWALYEECAKFFVCALMVAEGEDPRKAAAWVATTTDTEPITPVPEGPDATISRQESSGFSRLASEEPGPSSRQTSEFSLPSRQSSEPVEEHSRPRGKGKNKTASILDVDSICSRSKVEVDLRRPPEASRLIAQILQHMSALLGHVGRSQDSKRILERVLTVQEKLSGADSNEVADVLVELAWQQIVLHQINNEHGAVSLLVRALQIQCKEAIATLAPAAQQRLAAQATLDSPEWEQVLSLAAKSIKNRRFSISVNRAAVAYNTLFNYRLAERLLDISLRVREQTFGSSHPFVATAITDQGSMYARQFYDVQNCLKKRQAIDLQKYSCSKQELEEEMRRSSLDKPHALMEVLYRKAQEKNELAHTLRKETLGPRHPFTASVLYAIADMYNGKGLFEKALELMTEVLDIRTSTLGLNNKQTINVQRRIREIRKELGKAQPK